MSADVKVKRNGIARVEREPAAGGEMTASAAQKRPLVALRQQGLEGVAAGKDQVEAPAEVEIAQIAFDPADGERSGLTLGIGQHGRRPIERFERSISGVDDTTRRAFYHDNFVDLIGDRLAA